MPGRFTFFTLRLPRRNVTRAILANHDRQIFGTGLGPAAAKNRLAAVPDNSAARGEHG